MTQFAMSSCCFIFGDWLQGVQMHVIVISRDSSVSSNEAFELGVETMMFVGLGLGLLSHLAFAHSFLSGSKFFYLQLFHAADRLD